MKKEFVQSKEETASATSPGAPKAMPALLAHDHSELDELLAGFFAALSARRLEQSFSQLDRFWARLAMHIRAEHLHLFPTLLRALERPLKKGGRGPSLEIARSTISRLQEDHDYFMRELAAAVKQLGALRSHPSEPGLRAVQEQVGGVSRRLETHNELEESQVYPWADLVLESAEHVVLDERMQKELGNLPPRFKPEERSRFKI
ncbi:MAG: hemerythrin domain-containing protein [Chthoniobacterales bacterium]